MSNKKDTKIDKKKLDNTKPKVKEENESDKKIKGKNIDKEKNDKNKKYVSDNELEEEEEEEQINEEEEEEQEEKENIKKGKDKKEVKRHESDTKKNKDDDNEEGEESENNEGEENEDNEDNEDKEDQKEKKEKKNKKKQEESIEEEEEDKDDQDEDNEDEENESKEDKKQKKDKKDKDKSSEEQEEDKDEQDEDNEDEENESKEDKKEKKKKNKPKEDNDESNEEQDEGNEEQDEGNEEQDEGNEEQDENNEEQEEDNEEDDSKNEEEETKIEKSKDSKTKKIKEKESDYEEEEEGEESEEDKEEDENEKLIKKDKMNLKSLNVKVKNKTIEERVYNFLIEMYDIICVICNLQAYTYYFLTLAPTKDKNFDLLTEEGSLNLYYLALHFIYPSVLISIEITLFVNNFVYFFHLVYLSLMFLGTLIYDHGINIEENHGFLSFLIFLGLTLSLFIVEFILTEFFKKMYKYKLKGIVISVVSFFSFIFLVSKILKLDYSCNNWDKSLNGTSIYNNYDVYDCGIMKPNKCYTNTFISKFLDFSQASNLQCSADRDDERENLVNTIPITDYLKSISQLKEFEYPDTTDPIFDISRIKEMTNFRSTVISNIFPSDLLRKRLLRDKSKPAEVKVIFDKTTNLGSVYINLVYNNDLSRSRNNKAKFANSMYNNILFIYLNSVSRAQFIRKMKKTAEFFKTFVKYKNNVGFSGFEFLKYHTFEKSDLNAIPMFYGTPMRIVPTNNIVYYLKELGYVTGQSINECSKEVFTILSSKVDNVNKINFDRYDHENIAMFCDPNHKRKSVKFISEFEYQKRCLYGNETHDYVFEYGKQFWEAYLWNKKFLRLGFFDGSEPTGEVIKYLDEKLFNFLKMFYVKGYLANTAIFIANGHGNSLLNLYSMMGSDNVDIERHLALFLMIIPNSFGNEISGEIYHNLVTNQQVYLSPYDVHDTLVHIATGSINNAFNKIYSKNGGSVFSILKPRGRECRKYLEEISEDKYCKCEWYDKIL